MKSTTRIFVVLILCLVFSGLIPAAPVRAAEVSKRNYIIVLGTDALKTSTGLEAFAAYKSINFDVTVISVADIAKQFSAVTNPMEQVRQYLSTKVQPVPPYVLLVGKRSLEINGTSSHQSFIGTIPMAVSLLDGLETPTDLLYRFPNLHFDSLGEIYIMPPAIKSPINFIVGSIPVDDRLFLDLYFDELISLEKTYPKATILNGIIANSVLGYGSSSLQPIPSDSAETGETIKSIMAASSAIVTLYEKGGSRPSTYTPTLPLTETNFTSVWNSQFHDWAFLTGHNATYSLYWPIPDPGIEKSQETAIWRYFADLTKLTNKVFFGLFNGCLSAHPVDIEALNGFFKKKLVYTGIGYTGAISGTAFSSKIFQRMDQGYSIGDSLQYKDKQTQELMEEEILGDPSACLMSRKYEITLSRPSNAAEILSDSPIIFSWKMADPVWAYNIQVSNSSDFTNLVKSDITYTNSYQITSLPTGNYCWRVQSVYDKGASDWSETKSFKVYEPLNLVVSSLPTQVSNHELVVSGSTTGSRILVNNQEQIVTSGKFSTVVTLSLGKNTIKVTAFDDYGHSVTKELVITYQALKPEMVLELTIGIPKIWINGKATVIDAAPIITNSRTLVPLRAIFEAVGGDVGWDPATRRITIVSRGQNLTLNIGNNTATLDGKTVSIDSNPKVVPTITNGRTLIPLRFVAEAFGFQVDWNAEARSIVLIYGGGS